MHLLLAVRLTGSRRVRGASCRDLGESGFSHEGQRGLVRGPDVGKAVSYGF